MTHQLQYIQECDTVLGLSKVSCLHIMQETYNELQYTCYMQGSMIVFGNPSELEDNIEGLIQNTTYHKQFSEPLSEQVRI